jgi:hypothetical protein
MVPLFSELWKLAQYLLRPEGQTWPQASVAPVWTTAALRRAAACKPLLWFCLAVLAGLGLSRLSS